MLWTHSQVTLTEILLGFGLTIVTAIPLGLLIALSPLAKQIVYPPIMLMQLVPKIAVAPLFLVWLGFGIESKVLLTVLMTFFPLLLASISGFQILDDRLLYLTKSMGATSWQTFRYLRFPAALPVIFSGIKTSATIAATAAIVAEFVGANKGLGYVLLRGTSTMDIELVFAVLVVLTIIGIAINYARRVQRMGDDAVAAREEQLVRRRHAMQPATSTRRRGRHRRSSLEEVTCINVFIGSRSAPACRRRHWSFAAGRRTARTRRSRSSSTGWPAGRTPASPRRVAEGYYKDAGLDVTLVQGNGSGNTAQLVANGRAQLAYADAVAVSQLIAKGAPMKIVVDRSTSRTRTR